MNPTQTKKTKHQTTQPSWLIRYRSRFKTASIVIVAVVFVIGITAVLFKNGNKSAQVLEEPVVLSVDMPGWWFKEHFGSSICEKDSCKTEADPDGDGLNNGQEFYYHSSPNNPDTNGNGKNDGDDVSSGIDPSKSGNMTFDQAASDDQIFGESLAFSDSIRMEIAESINPNNINVQLIGDDKVRVTQDNSIEKTMDYFFEVDRSISKYFTKDKAVYVTDAIKSNDRERLMDVKLRAAEVSSGLQRLEVPSDLVTIHKYTVAYFDLLQIIIFVPDDTKLLDEYDATGNRWYEATQSFMVLMQRMDQEVNRLNAKYNLSL